jgi:hypothetical protein
MFSIKVYVSLPTSHIFVQVVVYSDPLLYHIFTR